MLRTSTRILRSPWSPTGTMSATSFFPKSKPQKPRQSPEFRPLWPGLGACLARASLFLQGGRPPRKAGVETLPGSFDTKRASGWRPWWRYARHHSRHDGQNERGGTRLVMKNDIRRLDHARGAGLLFAGVQVAVEAREIAAGYFQPQFVARKENIARGPQVHGDVIGLSRICQLRFFLRIPVTQPQDSARQILRESIRPNVYEHPREIRVHRRTAYVQIEGNRSGQFGVPGKRRR